MHVEAPHGNVLVLVDEPDAGELLGRAVAATGERPWVVRSTERWLGTPQEVERVDLVLTLLSVEATGRSLLRRLLVGDLLPGVPRIHHYRTSAAQAEVASGGPEAALLSLPYPPDPLELQLRVRLGAEIGRLRRELRRGATRDAMTGLANREVLLERLDEEFARARRHRSALSLVLLDVDDLATINDSFGSTTGDSVVQQFAAIVRAQVRREDLLGRLRGALLAVVMPQNGYRGAATFANKVLTEASEVLLQDGDAVHQVHVSAGVTTYPDCPRATTPEELLRAAEGALVEAKARGGNRVFIDQEVLQQERRVVLVADPDPELLDLAEDLLALDDYQVVRAETPRVVLETLRFRRPDLLVIDLHMTEREGGVPLIEQIHRLFPSAGFPIIGLSRDSSTPREQLARLGVDRFITKPFSLSLLRGAARDLLESARTEFR